MLAPGQIIDDKYRIVRIIGEGGMGAVFEGENTRIHRRVAIKVLHLGIAQNQDSVARFEREAQAAGCIGSDHIVEVLDLGNLPQGERFMVMEYLDGEHLGNRIQARGRLDAKEASAIILQLLEGLGAAHAAGIIHRDLKPENIFLLRSKKGHQDFVKILDFGISKFNALGSDSALSMTRTGTVMGTPYYMAPEQARGSKHSDVRSDLYGVGVILYEAVTGTVPFQAETFNELIFKIALETPPPPQQLNPSLDPAFAQIIAKGMARDPAARFQSASEFSQALQEWLARAAGAGAAASPHGPGSAGKTAGAPPEAAAARASSTVKVPTPPSSAYATTPTPWSRQPSEASLAVPAGVPRRRASTGRFVLIALGGLALGSLVAIGALKRPRSIAPSSHSALTAVGAASTVVRPSAGPADSEGAGVPRATTSLGSPEVVFAPSPADRASAPSASIAARGADAPSAVLDPPAAPSASAAAGAEVESPAGARRGVSPRPSPAGRNRPQAGAGQGDATGSPGMPPPARTSTPPSTGRRIRTEL